MSDMLGIVGLEVAVMYGFVCHVVADEIMKNFRTRTVYLVCWLIGVSVFGPLMNLTWGGLFGWIAAALFVAPMAAFFALALAAKKR